MLFKRRLLLLSLLNAFNQRIGNTDFQKLLFLYTMEHEKKPSFDFVPYRFGAFSFTSYADKRRLIETDMLVDDDNNWCLAKAGTAVVRKSLVSQESISQFCKRYSKLRGDELITEVYKRYPFYATRSEIVERVLPNPTDRARIEATRPPTLDSGLITIGYEGKTLEMYLNQLIKASVTLLCDVRRNPLSRKYGFSKKALRNACAGVGIRYEHIPELGIESSSRQELKTESDYKRLFATYKKDKLSTQNAALSTIKTWITQDNHRVALTCFEEKPSMCHRHCITNELEQLGGFSHVAQHL